MKEYGGFIQLELPKQKEYFDTVEEKDILRLNCGRSTFYCAAKDAKIKKIYMIIFFKVTNNLFSIKNSP